MSHHMCVYFSHDATPESTDSSKVRFIESPIHRKKNAPNRATPDFSLLSLENIDSSHKNKYNKLLYTIILYSIYYSREINFKIS